MKTHIYCCVALGALLYVASCVTTAPVKKAEEALPFVNTELSADGRLYSVRVFSTLTDVQILDARTRQVLARVPETAFHYDTLTTELVFIPGAQEKRPNAVYHIAGIPARPAQFVLAGYDARLGMPGVFCSGAPLKRGTDYVFNPQTATLSFSPAYDIEQLPYMVVWMTTTGATTYSDNIDG
ncbi:MAG: hypothetical protein IJ191_01880, partial [Treponema sp.]|nr:hypothetical protein [Treponema sp.]